MGIPNCELDGWCLKVCLLKQHVLCALWTLRASLEVRE